MTIPNDPIGAAKGLRTIIMEARSETEANRCLAPSVTEALIETGLCRLAVPSELGGHEADPLTILKVWEELAGAEASVAWTVWNCALPSLQSRHLSHPVRKEILGDSRRIMASSTRPQGKAIVENGGYRVSGRWSLVSGCELAD